MMSRIAISVLALLLVAIAVTALSDCSPIVVAGLAAAALIITLIIFRLAILPISTLASGADMIRGLDFNSRLRTTGHDDTDRLVKMFNEMMGSLNSARLRVRETNRYLDLLVEASPMGIINLDINGNIDLINPAASRLLGISPDEVKGKPRSSLPGPMAKVLNEITPGRSLTLNLRSGATGSVDDRIMAITCYSFLDRGFPRLTIFIEPLTDIIRSAERSAYNRIIRVMAHEINNSMGAVRSTLDLLADTPELAADPELPPLIHSCAARAAALTTFIDSYARVARLPEPSPVMTDMMSLLTDILPALRAIARGNALTLSGTSFRAMIDPIQIEQVMVNVVKNAAESIARSGRPDGRIDVTLNGSGRMIEITDNGAGIPADVVPEIFTPFFSTKRGAEASGIGLTLTADILRAHRASFSLGTSPADGLTRFILRLPPP